MQGPRLDQLFSIWWLRTWRGALGGIAAVAPFALGFWLLARAGIQSPLLRLVEQLLILAIGSAIAWMVSRMALGKRYVRFRIALLPPGADGPELAVTNRRVLSFWWLLVWRVALGAGAIGLCANALSLRLPPAATRPVQIAGILLILGWEFIVLRMALMKRYRDFRIVLITEPQR